MAIRGTTRKVNIGAYIGRFHGRLSRFKKGVLIKLFGSVIKDTPVLSGRLRGNWEFTNGAPGGSVTDSTTDPTGKVVAGVNAQVTEKDGKHFLTNSLPYVNRIEYEGHSSTKAPEGMVRKNLVRIERLIKEQVRR
jgi:hypothetical protein